MWMVDEGRDPSGAEPVASDLQLSEGKSLSFLATNVAGPIDLGGLPLANGTPEALDGGPSIPTDSSEPGSPPEPVPPDAE